MAEAPADWVEAVAAAAEDPASELHALVWGPRFDREQALVLLARLPRLHGHWLQAMRSFADGFDASPPAGQRVLRERLLRMADNAACRASC